MGILSKFGRLMKANINHLIDRERNPKKAIRDTIRELKLDLGTLKSESHAHESAVRRAKQNLNECKAEILKMERFSKKALDSQEELRSLQFLEQKEQLQEKKEQILKTYNEAQVKEKQLKLLEEKLTLDISQLEKRYNRIKVKESALDRQKLINENSNSSSLSFDNYEEQLKFKLDEANALAELRGNPSVLSSSEKSIDEEIDLLKMKNNKS